jgi:hypothetical protein
LRVVLMAHKTSSDSTERVSNDIFCGIHTSFTTQAAARTKPSATQIGSRR